MFESCWSKSYVISPKHPDDYWAYIEPNPVGTEVPLSAIMGPERQTLNHHLVPRLRVSGAILPLLLYISMDCTGVENNIFLSRDRT